MEHYAIYRSPVGSLLLIADNAHLTGIYFENQYARPSEFRNCEHPILRKTHDWLDAYFAGNAPDPETLPLKPAGTPFQVLVWKLLLEIPYGHSTTYGAMAQSAAKLLGKERMSAQAIGNAVGKNPISIVIPCHRCLGTGGKLTGYAGGLERKEYLLRLEGIQYI